MSDTLNNKQMDAAVEAAEADTQRAIDAMMSAPPTMIRVSVTQDGAVVYENVYPIKEAGDLEAATQNAVAAARSKVQLRPWGWTLQTSKA